MDKTIKTRHITKDIKTLAHCTGVASAAKAACIKTRETANGVASTQENEPGQPGEATLQVGGKHLASKSVATTAKTANRAKSAHMNNRQAKKHAQDTAREAARQNAAPQPQETASARAAKQSATTKEKATRATSKSPKTATVAGHVPVKTAQQAQRPATKPANALKALTRRNSYSQHTATRVLRTAKSAAHGGGAFAKMAVAAAKSLATAFAAIGGTALSIVIVISLAAFIAVSAFGIFFTGGDLGDGNPTLREVVTRLNDEHTTHIDKIKADNPHDKVSTTGSKTPWKEVLSVFAVKTTSDADNSLDVVTLDATRQKLLERIFWDMNKLGSHVEDKESVDIVLEEDSEGNLVEVGKTTTEKVLYIELSHTTADEAASTYGFGRDQLDMLHQLLSEQYDSLWQSVLYGIGRGSGDIVDIAATQIGNVGGGPFWSWYGFAGRVEWCACFVSWCANECGYIEQGIIPKFAYCPTGVQWFKDAGAWKDGGYAPQPGDIIFFDWGGDGVSDHVGIVESCDGTTVHTIEGNSGDACRRNSYSVGSASIVGYGTPRPQ